MMSLMYKLPKQLISKDTCSWQDVETRDDPLNKFNIWLILFSLHTKLNLSGYINLSKVNKFLITARKIFKYCTESQCKGKQNQGMHFYNLLQA